jgi:hypothetical protein
MKELGSELNKLAIRLRNNQREIDRLMEEYETLDAVVVTGSKIQDMDDWLVQLKRKRRAEEVELEPLENTQTTDSSYRSQTSGGESQISDAASEALAHGEFSDDFTGDDEDEENEDRSVDTRTGLPDSQLTDGSYDDHKEKKKRKKRAKKAAKKTETKRKTRSPPRSPSYESPSTGTAASAISSCLFLLPNATHSS